MNSPDKIVYNPVNEVFQQVVTDICNNIYDAQCSIANSTRFVNDKVRIIVLLEKLKEKNMALGRKQYA